MTSIVWRHWQSKKGLYITAPSAPHGLRSLIVKWPRVLEGHSGEWKSRIRRPSAAVCACPLSIQMASKSWRSKSGLVEQVEAAGNQTAKRSATEVF